jgi:hypothetical protein
MNVMKEQEQPIMPGDIYEDCAFHPVLCVKVDDDEVSGVSLVDGSWPRSCSLSHCGVRKLTLQQAWHWKLHGPANLPADVELKGAQRWWERSS